MEAPGSYGLMVSLSKLKYKLRNLDHLSVLSARNVKEMMVVKLYQQISEEQVMIKSLRGIGDYKKILMAYI